MTYVEPNNLRLEVLIGVSGAGLSPSQKPLERVALGAYQYDGSQSFFNTNVEDVLKFCDWNKNGQEWESNSHPEASVLIPKLHISKFLEARGFAKFSGTCACSGTKGDIRLIIFFKVTEEDIEHKIKTIRTKLLNEFRNARLSLTTSWMKRGCECSFLSNFS